MQPIRMEWDTKLEKPLKKFKTERHGPLGNAEITRAGHLRLFSNIIS